MAPSEVTFCTLDVFTTKPFSGNQLAVVDVTLASPLSQETKQAIAREFNFSETVFLHERDPRSSELRLDIFTPTAELPSAGHPVIGTLCHVFQTAESPSETVRLGIKAGTIVGNYDRDGKRAEAQIPQNIRIHQVSISARVLLAMQPTLRAAALSHASVPLVSIVKGLSFVLVELASVSELEELHAEQQTINGDAIALDEGWAPSFTGMYYYAIVSQTEHITNVRCRMIEPSIGEDPATGSAASTLASFLSLKEGKAAESHIYTILQGIEMGRASEIHVKVTLDDRGEAVESLILAGSAVHVTRGTLRLPQASLDSTE